MSACSLSPLIAQHFAGTLAPGRERTMRVHLPTCAQCREVYRRRLLLSRLDPEALAPEERIARGLGLRSRHRAAWGHAFGVAGLALAAAAFLVVIRPARQIEAQTGFSARGPVVPAVQASRVLVYRIGPDGRAAPVKDAVHVDDELAFAYENAAAKARIAIFGVDDRGRVYWFFPAWTTDASDPVALPIERDAQRHELPEAVRHRFEGTRLEIRSVFMDDAVSVRRIEALLQRDPKAPLGIPGAIERSLTLQVEP